MADRRRVFWFVFLGTAGALSLIPQFFDAPPELAVQAAPRPRGLPLRPEPAEGRGAAGLRQAEPERQPVAGPLDALRSPDAPPAGALAGSPMPVPDRAPDPAGPPERPLPGLFAAHSWYVPPPPPPAPPPEPPPPPPAPVVPPLPFAYLGKLAEGGSLRVFLVRGDRPYTVAEGDVIDGSYKVKRITDTEMTLVYLPLNLTQTLSVGSKP